MSEEKQKVGYKDLENCVMLAVELGNVGDRMGRTAGAAKYGQLLALIDELQSLATTDFSKIDDEVKDLDDAEKAELLQKVKLKLDLEDDKVEAVVEDALSIIKDAASVVQRSISLVKNMKAA